MKFGIVVFPGSNCDRDCYDAITLYLKQKAVYLWHQENDLSDIDCVILPGGFSYGDYLRSGAIARFSSLLTSLKQFIDEGRPVLGICNGFQILTEAQFLPGALVKNQSLEFICDPVTLRVENHQTWFTSAYTPGEIITLPIAHGEGNYVTDADTLKKLEDTGQIIFRYMNDVNGSLNRIAGIINERGNVMGMMPHPERNLWHTDELWSGDGAKIFNSLLASATAAVL